jgi:hypothetical protein
MKSILLVGAAIISLIATGANASPAFIDQVDNNLSFQSQQMTTSLDMLQPLMNEAGAAAGLMSSIKVPVGGLALVSQEGDNNTGLITQTGPFNLGLVQQIGNNNYGSISQSGGFQHAMIYQHGNGNVAIIRQR